MNRRDINQILENLGELIQEEQCEYQETEHEFSQKYKDKKQNLLERVGDVKRPWYRRPAAAAASLVLVAALSGSVYAAVKLLHTEVEFNKDDSSASVTSQVSADTYIPPIEITAEYLPEGYREWEEGKYSYQGEFGADGISIADASATKTEVLSDISDFEERQLSNARAFILTKEGYEYPYLVLLSFEETGHTLMVYGCSEISLEELIKVCENIQITEVPEKDPERTFQAYAYEKEEYEEIQETELKIKESQIVKMQEAFPEVFVSTEDGETAETFVTVTDVSVKDRADVSLLNENTTFDYEKTRDLLGEDGSLPDYTVVADYWDEQGRELKQDVRGTYPVKYVNVTAVMENPGEKDAGDVNAQPQFCSLVPAEEGGYRLLLFEEDKLTGEKDWRGCEIYELSTDHFPFYFDSSAFPGDSHFYNTALKAGEKKTVHFGFAVPEHWLENLYLAYGLGDEKHAKFVKLDVAF